MPTQMPEHRPAAGEPAPDHPLDRGSRAALHAGRVRTHARHQQPVGLLAARSRSAVRVTSAPARSTARTAERRLPDP